MAGIAIANVVAITGTAFARNAEGELRELQPGDVLLEGETLITPEGSQVELQMTDGTPLLVADLPEMAITADLMASTAPTATEGAIEADTVESIAQTLQDGGDLDALLDDTAAGETSDIDAILQALEGDGDILDGQEETAAGLGGGGQGEGHDFVLLDRIEEGTPDPDGLGDVVGAGEGGENPDNFDNNPPQVVPVSLGNIDEDTSLTITQSDLLAGATDSDGDELAAVNVTVSSGNGTVTDNGDGTFTFVPTEDFNGNVSFDFQVTDGFSTVDNAAALVVDPVDDNEAPETSSVALGDTDEDSEVTFDEADLLVGSSDPDGDVLSVVDLQVTNGAGTLVDNGDGTFTFTPNPDASGDVELSFGVTDGTETTTNTGSFTVNPVQDAFDDAASTEEDTAVVVNVLDNDTFEPGAEITSITQPANGTAELNADGTVTYTPNPDFSGDDSFTYTVTTAAGDTETATASVSVDPVEDIAGDEGSTDEDTAAVIDVLANDNFQEGSAISSVTQGENGSVTINEDGTLTYTPNPDYNGPDSFTYTVTNANGDEETATVDFTVEPVVDIAPDSAVTDEDTPVDIDVSANDTFEPGAVISEVTQGANGTVTINENGTINYTPNPDYNGDDSFSYTVTTVAGDTETTTVSVTVNPVDDANDDDETAALPEPEVLEDEVVVIDVLENDDFAGDVTVVDVTQPDGGTVTINPDNTLTFTPDPDFNGDVEFEYTVETEDGSTETATVSLPVTPVDDVLDDAGETEEGVPVVVDVLTNDNFESDATVTGVTDGSNGTVSINPDGTVTYTPDDGFTGFDTFEYTATTEAGNTETASVTIDVTSAGDAQNDSATTDEDTAVDIDVMSNDTVPEGATLSSVTQPSNGTASLNDDGTVNYTPNPDFNGFDSFTYTVTTLAGNTETASVGVTVNPVVDIAADTIVTDEDTAGSINVLDNDNFESDAEVTAVTQGSNGSVSFDADGNVTYTPNPDFSGTDSFSYTATTEAGDTETTTVDVTVNPVVDIANDAIVTDEDVAGSVNVLANDSFEPGASVTGVTQASNGVVTFDANGDVTYTPSADFNGPDSFTYTVTTAAGDTETATVNVTVNQVEDIEADAATTDEDTDVNVDVLGNDDFASAASVTAVTQGASGTVSINPNGTINYAPGPEFNGSDSFTYTATNGVGDEETTTVDITVNPVDDIVDDTAVTNEDVAVDVDVLANDGFEPGAEVSGVTQGSNGSVVINPDGTVTYTPDPDFNGQDTFEYTATNVAGDQETATVTVTVNPVNDGPVAVDDANSTAEDVPVSSSLSLLNNDFDIDGDVLSVDAGSVGTFATTQGGSITVDVNGDYTYTPPADFSGSDTFDYTVTDGALTDVGTLTISVSSENDPPIAVNDSGSGEEGGTISVLNGGAVSILANDSDADGDALTVTSFTQPNNGTLSVNADGTFLYEHNGGETTGDSFQYTVSDGQGGQDTATVFLSIAPVNDPPVAVDDLIVVNEDQPVSSGTLSVLTNDTDVDGDSLSVHSSTVGSFTTAAGGFITMSANGTFSYVPPGDYNGPDSFDYVVTDGQETDEGTLFISVLPVNDPPNAVADAATVAIGGSLNISVLGNDSDPENDALSITQVTQGSNGGTVTINPNGTINYSHDGSDVTSDSFEYTISDGNGGFDTATVSVTLFDANVPPVAAPDSYDTDEDTSLVVDAQSQLTGVLDNDQDANGDPLTVSLDTDVSHGSLSLNDDGTFTYTPDPDYAGPDSFTYIVDDGEGGSDSTTVSITVNQVADIRDDVVVTDEDTPVDIDVLGNDLFEPGATIIGYSQGGSGSVGPDGSGGLTYSPNPDTNGSDSFTYTVRNVAGDLETARVDVAVTPVNDLSDEGESVTTNEDTDATGNVLTNTDNPDGPNNATVTVFSWGDESGSAGDTLEIQGVGTLQITSGGSFTFSPADDYDGEVPTASYSVTDGESTVSSDLALSITPENDPPEADPDFESTDEDTAVKVNVLDNDSDPEGEALTVSVAQGDEPDNGSVVVNNDGTITYTPDPGFEGNDIFTYTINDGNGGSDTATVTITVGADSTPTVSVSDGQVDEKGLPEGTAADAALLTDSGTFTINTAGDDLAKLSVEGKDGPVDVTTGGTVYGDYGTLVVSVSGGSYAWDYTLTDNTLDHPTNPSTGTSEGVSDDFTVTVEDSDGDVSPADTLSVSVLDDGPLDESTDSVGDNIASTTFDAADLFLTGADGADLSDVTFSLVASQGLRAGGVALNESPDAGTSTWSTVDGTPVFTLTAIEGEDGGDVDYTFTLDSTLDLTIDRDFNLTEGVPAGAQSQYSLIFDADTGVASITKDVETFSNPDLIATITPIDNSPSNKVNSNQTGIGSAGPTIDPGDQLKFTYNPATGTNFAQFNLTGTAVAFYVVTYMDGTDSAPIPVTVGASTTIEVTASVDHGAVMIVNLQATSGKYQVASASSAVEITENSLNVEFTYTGLDGDNDPVSGDFVVSIDPASEALDGGGLNAPPPAPAPAPAPAEEEANIVDATDGSDTLLGTDGDDVFAWSLADNSVEGDTIVDFGDGDAIDLRDLLVGEDAEGGNLSEYLNITSDGTDTVIEVSSGGGFAGGYDSSAVDQVITVEGVDLTSGSDQDAIIQSLLDAGKLITD